MAETEEIVFKTEDDYIKAVWQENLIPANPRSPYETICSGTMIFPVDKNNKNYYLGDEQPENFRDYFKNELSYKNPGEYFSCNISAKFPTLEEAQHSETLKKFIAGNKETGYYFDKALFCQEMGTALDHALNFKKDDKIKICSEIQGGIPIDENGKLLDKYEVNFTTEKGTYNEAYSDFRFIKNMLIENLEKIGITSINSSEQSFNSYDELNEKQLFDKWKENKAAVLGISVYEHGGITCHESLIDFDKYNDLNIDGFIFLDKNETLNSDEAVKILQNEIKEYASYLEGDVHSVSFFKFNKEKLEWETFENDNFYKLDNIYELTAEKFLSTKGITEKDFLNSDKVKELENSLNPEFTESVMNEFFSSVKKKYDDFDQNLKHACKSVVNEWKTAENLGAAKFTLKLKAFNNFFNEKGFNKPGKENEFYKYIAEECNVSYVPSLKDMPLSFKNNHFNCIYSKINNQNRSDNGCVKSALLYDNINKRFAFVTGCSYVLDAPSDTYLNYVELAGDKKVKSMLEKFVCAGWKNTPVSEQAVESYRKNNQWIESNILKKTIER